MATEQILYDASGNPVKVVPIRQGFQTGGQPQTDSTVAIQQAVDERFSPLIQQAGQQAVAPTIPSAGVQQPIQISEIPQEEFSVAPLTVAPTALTAPQISTEELAQTIPTPKTATQVAAATTEEIKPTPEVAQASVGTVSAESIIPDIQQTLSSGALAEAQTETLDQRATVQFQLEELYKSLDEGVDLPAWAAPAARNVDAFMLKRGLGSSSMAAAARLQALQESALPIAAQDAERFAAIQTQNLNNKQAAALQNAATTARLDTANLEVRFKSAQQNAESFLKTDLTNVSNDQQINMLNHQSRMQELFNDQAALNAARNFNAKYQDQVDQFYDTLGNNVEQTNLARELAVREANAASESVFKRFNESTIQERNQFNAKMQAQIDASNVAWRRQITTLNNQLVNEADSVNTRNLLAISETRQNQLWQQYRDEALWANTAFENDEGRAHALAIAALQFNQQLQAIDVNQDLKFNETLGKFGLNFVDKLLFN